MTGDEFKLSLKEVFGPKGWEKRASVAMEVTTVTLWRWRKMEKVPKMVELAMKGLRGND